MLIPTIRKLDLQKDICYKLTSHETDLVTLQTHNLQLYTIPLLYTAYLFFRKLFKTQRKFV